MRVVVIGDVGVVDGMMHIGDEAMFDAMVEALRERGAGSIVGISSAPEETAARYRIEAVRRLGFEGSAEDRRQRRAAVVDAAGGARSLPADDPARAVIEAVAAADGVVIAGGGNLASNWPMHISERATLGAIARRLGRPVVVSGQTLGPRLEGADRAEVAELLRGAALVGAREPASAGLAADLGVRPDRLAANRDDAGFLGFGASPPAQLPGAYVLVSLSLHLGALPRTATAVGLASSLDALAERTGLPLVFHPHFGSVDPDVIAGDAILHEEVRSALRTTSQALPPGDPRSAAHLARGASMLVTSRYHPAVFAAPAGIPIAALSVDGYTSVKLRGALGWWASEGVLDLATAASPSGPDLLTRIWNDRMRLASEAERRRPAAYAATSTWFDRVVAAAGDEPAPRAGLS